MDWIIYGCCLTAASAGAFLSFSAPGLYTFRKKAALTRREWSAFFRGGEWKKRGPGKYLAELMMEDQRRKAEGEIGQAVSYLRNAAAMGRGESMSTGLILEELAELQGGLSPIYLKMLHYLRLNEKEKVISVFEEAAGSRLAADFARLLLQWEEIQPVLLVESLESYQKNIREVRLTRQKKRDETVSDLIYLPVIMNVMLVLINFIYVAYFIDQREALLNMFG